MKNNLRALSKNKDVKINISYIEENSTNSESTANEQNDAQPEVENPGNQQVIESAQVENNESEVEENSTGVEVNSTTQEATESEPAEPDVEPTETTNQEQE